MMMRRMRFRHGLHWPAHRLPAKHLALRALPFLCALAMTVLVVTIVMSKLQQLSARAEANFAEADADNLRMTLDTLAHGGAGRVGEIVVLCNAMHPISLAAGKP